MLPQWSLASYFRTSTLGLLLESWERCRLSPQHVSTPVDTAKSQCYAPVADAKVGANVDCHTEIRPSTGEELAQHNGKLRHYSPQLIQGKKRPASRMEVSILILSSCRLPHPTSNRTPVSELDPG